MADINQLVNQQLDHLVESGNYMGGVNAHLIQNQQWCSAGTWVPVPRREGEGFKINESEAASPDQDASTPTNLDSKTVVDYINNGMSMTRQKHGHYEMNMKPWQAATDFNVDDAAMAFDDTIMPGMQFIGEKAGRTADLQCRRALLQGYLGGNTYSTAASGSPVTTLNLKDVNGFMKVWESGVPFAVSGSNPLAISVTNGVLGTVTKSVIGCTPGTRNNADDTIPGTVTLAASIAQIAIGDHVVSSQAPPHIAPGGKSSPYDIAAGDTLNLTTVMDILATLTSHSNSPLDGGFFKFIGDTTHQSQFWRDSAFREAYRGQYGSKELREGAPVTVGKIHFEFSHMPARSVNEAGATVRRAVIVADGALSRGYFEKDPTQTYNYVGDQHNRSYDAENKYHLTLRKPIDAQGKIITFSYLAYWGWACRTDSLAAFGDNPNAPLKRGVGLFSN